MQNISDQTGRSLEYEITRIFESRFGGVLTARATESQTRDSVKFRLLPPDLSTHFTQAANLLADIFANRYSLIGCSIDRLADSAAREGDVTDIRLRTVQGQCVNLSVKNNHHALKHQRPPSLMQQLSFPKKSEEDIAYRDSLGQIYTSFYNAAHKAVPGAVNFRDLKESDETFIDTHLYLPICNHVAAYLKQHLSSIIPCQHFFLFLVGNIDYLKVILNSSTMEIENYSAIPLPTAATVDFSAATPNMVYVHFNNNWSLSLRIHTAASSMGRGTPSLKFDTQPMCVNIPKEVYDLY